MFKRPQLRPRATHNVPSSKPEPGTFLHSILYPEKTTYFEPNTYFMQDYDNYVLNLRRSCENSGVEFKIPRYAKPLPKTDEIRVKEKPRIEFSDGVIVRLNVLKCGKIRVKLLTNMATLYEKYFSKSKKPPLKVLISALKAVGYDDEYLQALPKVLTDQKNSMEMRWNKLDAIFNKPSATTIKKKSKKKDEEQPDEEEREDEDENEEDDDAAPDEEAIEIDDEEEVEVVEDDYFSDED